MLVLVHLTTRAGSRGGERLSHSGGTEIGCSENFASAHLGQVAFSVAVRVKHLCCLSTGLPAPPADR